MSEGAGHPVPVGVLSCTPRSEPTILLDRGERTTRNSKATILLESAGEDVRGTCIDEFSWTIEGDLLARHVVDSTSCSGSTDSEVPWTLILHPGDNNAYVGALNIGGESTNIRFRHWRHWRNPASVAGLLTLLLFSPGR